jgi:hypothetical protein
VTGPGIALLATGPRAWTDVAYVEHRVELADRRAREEMRHVLLIHGGAQGLDSMIRQAGVRAGWAVVTVPYFEGVGKAGGPLRNRAMVAMLEGLRAAGWDCRCWAFGTPDAGGGTAGCAGMMAASGFTVRWWNTPIGT